MLCFDLKVSNFTKSNGEENGSFVNVTWFGSSTTSYLNSDQINPFLDFYKVCNAQNVFIYMLTTTIYL